MAFLRGQDKKKGVRSVVRHVGPSAKERKFVYQRSAGRERMCEMDKKEDISPLKKRTTQD